MAEDLSSTQMTDVPAEETAAEVIPAAPAPVNRTAGVAVMRPPPVQMGGARKMPEMNLDNAYKVINFYQTNPQWLANPNTAHVANADFAYAGKVISYGMQMERLNNQAAAAQGQNAITKQIATSLLKMAESGQDGAALAAKWYSLDESGQPLYMNPANAPKIFADYQAHTVSKDVQPKPITITLEDGSTVNAIYNPKTGSHTVIKPVGDAEAKATAAERTKRINALESEAAGIEKNYLKARADFEQMRATKPKDSSLPGYQARMETYMNSLTAKRRDIKRLTDGATQAPATPAVTPQDSGATNAIPASAIDYLKANPSLREQFNTKYGAGAADKYLSQ